MVKLYFSGIRPNTKLVRDSSLIEAGYVFNNINDTSPFNVTAQALNAAGVNIGNLCNIAIFQVNEREQKLSATNIINNPVRGVRVIRLQSSDPQIPSTVFSYADLIDIDAGTINYSLTVWNGTDSGIYKRGYSWCEFSSIEFNGAITANRIILNGQKPKNIRFNNNECKRVVFNGMTVFEK